MNIESPFLFMKVGPSWLLASQKPIKRPGWWEWKFALFWMPATQQARVRQTPVQMLTCPLGKSFYRQREGATGRNSTVSSDNHLEIGHWWSDQQHIDCFKWLIFSSRVSLFPFLWGQFLNLWQLMSWLQSSHHAANFFHLVGVSVSVRQLTRCGSEYYL